MRISLKQTILLSTALLAMNLSLSAMEATDEKSKFPASATAEIPAKEYSFLQALEIVTPIEGSREDTVLKQTLALLTDERVPAAESGSESSGSVTQPGSCMTALDQSVSSLDDLETQFKAYKENKITLPFSKLVAKGEGAEQTKTAALSLTWQSPPTGLWNSITTAFSPSELNNSYQALFDDLYALVEATPEIILARLESANIEFGKVIENRKNAVMQFSKQNGTTAESNSRIQKAIQDLSALKVKEQNRFKRAIFDFVLTRNLFTKLNKDKETYKGIIAANTGAKALVPSTTKELLDAEQFARANINYICEAFLKLEAFIKCTYPFSRSWVPTTTNKIVVGKRTFTKQRRFDMTGVDTLPGSMIMPLTFFSVKSRGEIDKDIVQAIQKYMRTLLSDSYALQEAVDSSRIAYLTEIEFAALSVIPREGEVDTSRTAAASITSSNVDVGGEGTGTKADGVSTDLSALAITAAVIEEAEQKDGNKDRKKVKEKKKKEGGTPTDNT